MSEPINDGGPAFPLAPPEAFAFQENGMSLRDWFAGMALSSMIVAPDYSRGVCNAEMVSRAYVIADAMLAERSKP